jgi:hypothetical protein
MKLGPPPYDSMKQMREDNEKLAKEVAVRERLEEVLSGLPDDASRVRVIKAAAILLGHEVVET